MPSSDQGELVWSVVCLNVCASVVEGMLSPHVSSDSFVVNFETETIPIPLRERRQKSDWGGTRTYIPNPKER